METAMTGPHASVARGRDALRGGLPLATALLCAAAMAPRAAQAAAFSIYEQSAAGTALAGALTARADDASTIFYNPAGLGFLPGLSVLAGGTLITAKPSAETAAGQTFEGKRGVFFLPSLFAAARVHDHFSVGVGAFASHGLGIDWQVEGGAPFPGRFKVQRASLQTFTINPTIAVRVLPMISLAAGFDAVIGAVELKRALALGQDEGAVDLAAGTTGFGGNVGVQVALLPGRLSAGFSYRSQVKLAFEGGKVGYTPPPGVAGAFPYTTGGAEIELPHTFAFGAAARIAFLSVSADLNAVQWTSTRELRLVLSDEAGRLTQTSVTPRDWRETIAVRVGVEADLSRFAPRSFSPKVRVGFAYDQTPIPANTLDPSLPDGDRFLGSLGLSLGYRGLGSIDLGYMAVFPETRTSTSMDLPLRYGTSAHVASASLVLQLDNLIGRRSEAYARGLLSP